jgi:transposase-like protein
LITLMENQSKHLLCYKYVERESYDSIYPMLMSLRRRGLNPLAITLDGHKTVISAILEVWPDVSIQRCLYHIQRQGLSWLRVYPKTEAGRELRPLFNAATSIENESDMHQFLRRYQHWYKTYRSFIKSLPRKSVANTDLKKAMALINHALPDMFYYIKDRNIASTTNVLESFYSRLKHRYRSHRGLSKQHKISYLKWYCYFTK